MLSVAYVSVASAAMSDEDIAAILTEARTNNVHHELTGALLYHAGRFIQVLEGPDDSVRTRLERIAGDPRHRNLQVIAVKPIWQRQFPDWTMGFKPMTDASVRELEGFSAFFDERTGRARLEHAENEAQQFLEWLGEYWFAPH